MSTNFKAPGKSFSSMATADGSPTALGPTGEPMHHLEGALSETLYIYGPVAQRVYRNNWSPRFLSLGLGLGYVEMMTVARGLNSLEIWDDFYLHSFESESSLREGLISFLRKSSSAPEVYQEILSAVAKAHEIKSDDLRGKLHELWTSGKWILDGALHADAPWPHEKFSGIFFDAFSSKSSPELWTEEFLNSFLRSFAAPHCILRTYAATGTLKRALRAHEFAVTLLKGFANKRESTEGVRCQAPPTPSGPAPPIGVSS